MPDIPSVFGANFGINFVIARSLLGFAKGAGLALALLLLSACDRAPNPTEIINLNIYQKWQLQPGDNVAGFPVVSGLGDVSIELNGKSVYAPFEGQAQKDQRNCLIFSSADVPAYLFRLCGISNPRLGNSNPGDSLGSGAVLHFATLRKQPDGTWAIVEPSKTMIERILTKS